MLVNVKSEEGKIIAQKDVPVSEVTAENYICPDHEKHGYHVKMEIVEFSRTTGARISRPIIQKFNKKVFAQVRPELERQGYTITILHDPTGYEEQTAKQIEDAKIKAAVDAERKKMQSEMDAKIAEAVTKALAEQQAAKRAK